ncbi:MAG: hypothetical protein ACE5HU_01780 [Acidobacteriota bacterium]
MATNWWRTLELRWFVAGSIPPAVERWFVADERFDHPLTSPEREERIDCYLIPFGAHDLGVKLREGRLEIKRRIGSHRILRVNDVVRGVPEAWAKWMWRHSGGCPTGRGDWEWGEFRAEVSKVRWRRRLHLRHDADPPIASDHPETGFTVDLTQVVLERRPWWTLSFHVNSDFLDDPVATLREAASWTLERFPDGAGVSLRSENSFSYPVWLGTCGSDGRAAKIRAGDG